MEKREFELSFFFFYFLKGKGGSDGSKGEQGRPGVSVGRSKNTFSGAIEFIVKLQNLLTSPE